MKFALTELLKDHSLEKNPFFIKGNRDYELIYIYIFWTYIYSKPRGGGQEEVPHVRGQGQWLRVPGCDGAGTAERSYPSPRSEAAAERSYPTSEARGGG